MLHEIYSNTHINIKQYTSVQQPKPLVAVSKPQDEWTTQQSNKRYNNNYRQNNYRRNNNGYRQNGYNNSFRQNGFNRQNGNGFQRQSNGGFNGRYNNQNNGKVFIILDYLFK